MKNHADRNSIPRPRHQEDALSSRQEEQPKRARKPLKVEHSRWRSEMEEDLGTLSAHHEALLKRRYRRQSQQV